MSRVRCKLVDTPTKPLEKMKLEKLHYDIRIRSMESKDECWKVVIHAMTDIKHKDHIDNNFYGDMESTFLSLEVLEILTAVNGGEHFPLLSSVTILHCPKLVKLPMLQSIKKLHAEEVMLVYSNH
ncbi:disease resistance protein RGA2-like [Gossypium australe]|uniref:Disease resistance protein RGA2-like n=1 Tax=Gossypium australe TaxID=47621 RepID=A0A5B6W0H1_9ROSI|nr:disease resistance protein RGA2-like [Gossypium australe]